MIVTAIDLSHGLEGIKFFYSNKEPILLCSFANAQKTDINNRK